MANDNKTTGVFLGYAAIILLGVSIIGMSISVWAKPYTSAHDTTKAILQAAVDTTHTVVITNEAKNVFSESRVVDTTAINTAFLQKMRANGELLSSDEFASRITSYYNTLVAVLTALFVLFTIVTYLTIKSKFESKFEDKARDLEDKQRQKIVDELRSMLSDSKKINEVITTAVGGHIDDKIATKEEVDDLTSGVETNEKNIMSLSTTLADIKKKQQELFKVVADLQEQVSAGATVYTSQAGREEDGEENVEEAKAKTIEKIDSDTDQKTT